MANSKNTVTTVPLGSKLNMNRNRNQVCTTYDQMNDQNSPLYGGCLSPLHTKLQYTGNKSLIDKYGHRWYYSGTGLYRTDENNSNAVLARNFSGYYTFNDITFDESADTGMYWNGYIILCKKTTTNQVRYSICDATGNLIRRFYDNFDSNWTLKSLRLVNRNNVPFLITTAEGNNFGTPKVRVVVDQLNNSLTGIGTSVSKQVNLSLVKGYDYVTTIQGNNISAGGSSQQSSNNTYPIIVSDWMNVFFSGSMDLCFGITVLNKHLNGENLQSDFGYCNLVYDMNYPGLNTCRLSLADGNTGRFLIDNTTGAVARVTVTGGKSVKANITGDDNQLTAAGLSYNQSSDNNCYTTCPWGIFQDSSSWWVIGNYSPDGFTEAGGAGWESDRCNHVALSTNCNRTAITYSNIMNRVRCGREDNMMLVAYGAAHTANAIMNTDSDNEQWGMIRKVCNQTLTTNQYHYRMIFSGTSYSNGYKDSKTTGVSVMLDSMAYGQARTWPGIQSTTTIPTTNEGWENVWKNRYVNNDAFYCTTGSCTQVGLWRLMFNYREGFLSGISFAPNENNEGTLIAPWDEVDDGFVVSTSGYNVLWKDVQGKVHYTSAISADASNLLGSTEIVDNRYLLIKCSAPQNVFDLVTEKWGKFGSDWNNRVLQGVTRDWEQFNLMGLGARSICMNWNANAQLIYSKWHSSGTWASGFNVAYQATKTFSPSRLLPYVTGNYVYTGSPLAVGCIRPTDEVGFGSIDKCSLDYFCSSGTASPKFAGSLTGTSAGQVSTDFESTSLQGTAYPITSTGSLYNNMPALNIKFINSYNGKFATQIGDKGYATVYDGVRPVMLYNATSMVDNIKEFFIVQSQTYAVVDSYICAISYSSSNVINGIEQLVDVNGMKFIGAFPSVAYFYSPASRCIYAFTGDADLQLFVQSDRISTVYSHLYAPNNEWIFLATNDGLYILTQQNVFRVPYSQLGITSGSTISMFMTDDAWNVIQYQNGSNFNGIKVRLDKPDATWTTIPVVVETEFFGVGDMRQEVCDTWYVRVFKGDEDDNGSITYFTTTLTDIVSKTDEKETVITPDMWDSNNNAFIRYQPQYQMTQGSSLHIESAYPIAYLGVSHQADNTSISHINI